MVQNTVSLTDATTLTLNEGIQRLSQGMNSIHTLKPYIEMRASGVASTDPLKPYAEYRASQNMTSCFGTASGVFELPDPNKP